MCQINPRDLNVTYGLHEGVFIKQTSRGNKPLENLGKFEKFQKNSVTYNMNLEHVLLYIYQL